MGSAYCWILTMTSRVDPSAPAATFVGAVTQAAREMADRIERELHLESGLSQALHNRLDERFAEMDAGHYAEYRDRNQRKTIRSQGADVVARERGEQTVDVLLDAGRAVDK